MRKVFIGMILVFIDFDLTLNNIVIGLIPDFIGYFMMIGGLNEIIDYSSDFRKVLPFVKLMAVFSTISYILGFFGIWRGGNDFLGFVIGLIITCISIYICYCIVMGIREIEEKRGQDLNSHNLYSAWKVGAILNVVTYALLIFPVLAFLSILSSFIAYIFYLVEFNKTKNLFYEYNPE